jgi:hypothetical protein
MRVNITGGTGFAPNGHEDSAQGFNPGFTVQKPHALKVAQYRSGATVVVRSPAPNDISSASFRAHHVKNVETPGLKPS